MTKSYKGVCNDGPYPRTIMTAQMSQDSARLVNTMASVQASHRC